MWGNSVRAQCEEHVVKDPAAGGHYAVPDTVTDIRHIATRGDGLLGKGGDGERLGDRK